MRADETAAKRANQQSGGEPSKIAKTHEKLLLSNSGGRTKAPVAWT
jgi:hypothetical protein